MRKVLVILLLVALSACRTSVPSSEMTHNAINGLQGVSQAVHHIQATTPPECRSDVLDANLRAILTQVDNVGGQIKNIELACKTEKKVLESEKKVRDIVIISLVLGIIAYVFLRFKKWVV